jgi:hypothetical protein
MAEAVARKEEVPWSVVSSCAKHLNHQGLDGAENWKTYNFNERFRALAAQSRRPRSLARAEGLTVISVVVSFGMLLYRRRLPPLAAFSPLLSIGLTTFCTQGEWRRRKPVAAFEPGLTFGQFTRKLSREYERFWKTASEASLEEISNNQHVSRHWSEGKKENFYISPEEYARTLLAFVMLRAEELRRVAPAVLEASAAANSYHDFAKREEVCGDLKMHVLGDLHGNAGLLADWLSSHIDDNWKITDPNTRLVLVGDITDEGPFGVEAWYALMTLQLQNPDQVVIIKGDRDHHDIGRHCNEVKQKLGIQPPALAQELMRHVAVTSPAMVIFRRVREMDGMPILVPISHSCDTAAQLPALFAQSGSGFSSIFYDAQLRKPTDEEFLKECAPQVQDWTAIVEAPEQHSPFTPTVDGGLTKSDYSEQPEHLVSKALSGIRSGFSYYEHFMNKWSKQSRCQVSFCVQGHVHQPPQTMTSTPGAWTDTLVWLLNAQRDHPYVRAIHELVVTWGGQQWRATPVAVPDPHGFYTGQRDAYGRFFSDWHNPLKDMQV